MTSSEIGPIQDKLQITLSEIQINKLADITGSLPRHRKILPNPLVISLLTALGKDSNAETLQDIYRKFNELTGLNVSLHAWREQVIKQEFGRYSSGCTMAPRRLLWIALRRYCQNASNRSVRQLSRCMQPWICGTITFVRLDLTEDIYLEWACLPA